MSFYGDFLKYGDRKLAVDDSGFCVTYKELSVLAERISKVMPERSLVMQFCSNTIPSLCGYLSFLHNRSVPVMLDKKIDDALADRLISIYRPEYFYLPETLTDRIGDREVVFSYEGYVLVKTEFEREEELFEELGLLLTTSGSVGSPKLVRQSYKNISCNADSIAEFLELTEDEKPITTLPMNYTYGLSILNSHVNVGATIMMTENSVVSKAFWDFFKREGVTSFGGVPFTYEMLKKIRFFKMDLPSLKTMTQSGGKLSPEMYDEIAEYAERVGKKFVPMYGLTEATARVAYMPAEKAREKKLSVGLPIPGGKLLLIDTEGNEIEGSGIAGEMIYEGPNVTLGYAEEKAHLYLGDERHGRLETGDIAKRDDEGFYYIVGRKKRFLKLYGNRVNLDEIERIVKTGFPVDCAAVGTDKLCICYVTDESILFDVEAHLSHKTNINARAFKAVYIPEVPKNESGKTMYSKLANTIE